MRLGAVSYLNMLPYFLDDSEVICFPSPAQLNENIDSNLDLVGCSSAVFGLRSGCHLVEGFGISAQSKVRSVFLAPHEVKASQGKTWDEVRCRVFQPPPDWMSKLGLASPGSAPVAIRVFSNAHSAQSQWLFQCLFAYSGFRLEFWNTSDSILSLPTPEFEEWLISEKGGEYAPRDNAITARLFIGDLALRNWFERTESQRERCLDLADLWNEWTGLPCVFAGWCTRSTHVNQAEVRAKIELKLLKWEGLSSPEKRLAIGRYVKTHPQTNLKPLDLDFLSDYLDGIRFRFSTREEQTWSYYRQMWKSYLEMDAFKNVNFLPNKKNPAGKSLVLS